MTQFGLSRNKGKAREHYPYFMVLQHDLFRELTTRTVIPLADKSGLIPARGIYPVLNIAGHDDLQLTDLMTSTDSKRLNEAPVASARDLHHDIVSALDILITGS